MSFGAAPPRCCEKAVTPSKKCVPHPPEGCPSERLPPTVRICFFFLFFLSSFFSSSFSVGYIHSSMFPVSLCKVAHGLPVGVRPAIPDPGGFSTEKAKGKGGPFVWAFIGPCWRPRTTKWRVLSWTKSRRGWLLGYEHLQAIAQTTRTLKLPDKSAMSFLFSRAVFSSLLDLVLGSLGAKPWGSGAESNARRKF